MHSRHQALNMNVPSLEKTMHPPYSREPNMGSGRTFGELNQKRHEISSFRFRHSQGTACPRVRPHTQNLTGQISTLFGYFLFIIGFIRWDEVVESPKLRI